MIKFEIKTIAGEVAFTWESATNTIKETVEKFLKENVGTLLKNIDLSNLDLTNVNFDNSSFDNSSFDNSSFDNSSFDNSSFYNSSFYNSRFDNSSFDNSSFYNSSFYNSRFDNETIKNVRAAKQLKIFNSYKNDFWAKMLIRKNEVPVLKQKLIDGKIDGSCYEGDCCCFVGTIANAAGCKYERVEGLVPDERSPVEVWFKMIRPDDTPEKSEITKLTIEWIEEFEFHLNKTQETT